MASIFPRKNRNGSTSWRLMIRRKGLKSFISVFPSREEAIKFAQENEKKYCLDPENFTYDHLKARREREFS